MCADYRVYVNDELIKLKTKLIPYCALKKMVKVSVAKGFASFDASNDYWQSSLDEDFEILKRFVRRKQPEVFSKLPGYGKDWKGRVF